MSEYVDRALENAFEYEDYAVNARVMAHECEVPIVTYLIPAHLRQYGQRYGWVSLRTWLTGGYIADGFRPISTFSPA